LAISEDGMDRDGGSDEFDLLLRVRRGDRAAFGTLITHHMRRAYYVALGLVGSHDDAQDLSQEAFARLFRHHESLDPHKSFYGLLYQVLRRLCFNHLRDTRTRNKRLEEKAHWLAEEAKSRANGSDPVKLTELHELRSRLETAIEALSDKEREVLVLKELNGLKYREIGELLEIPIGTVMSRLYSARKNLARILELSE
jgi:RNA polymerase sigma-70 factor (ECF subfamily)